MDGEDPRKTQRDIRSDSNDELTAAGYDDVSLIGEGGFGLVYRCHERALDRYVAVKILSVDPAGEDLERFLREQRAMGRLSGHPNIVTILHVDVTRSGRPFIVMPYHKPGSLHARIRRDGPLDLAEILHIGVKVCGALETAHRADILHRDVKPANILLTEYAEPQLCDFGIARVSGGFETSTGAITGSPAFTAPEVMQGSSSTVSSDVYSLGATLFCALTGHAAAERKSSEDVVSQFLRMTVRPVDPGAVVVPDCVRESIATAMALEPNARFISAREFGDVLRDAQQTLALPLDDMDFPILLESKHDVGGHHHTGESGVHRYSGRRSGAGRTPTPPPTPATRFRPPFSLKGLVPRPRLVDAMAVDSRKRLTLIHGPAGFGKSALAALACNEMHERGGAIAWLTVDTDDNVVIWFVSHMIEALRYRLPKVAAELSQTLEQHGDTSIRYVLSAMINEIHGSGAHTLLVIDDWHRVTSPDTVAALSYLLNNACHHLQVIVTGRTQHGLPLSKLRLHDELIEIDSTALRFTTDEAGALFAKLADKELDPALTAELNESAEGWVTALQLASLTLRGNVDPATVVAGMTGSHFAVGEFLAENVLDALDTHALDFLMSTSVTERICGSLAESLANVDDGRTMLESLEERGLFIRRIDDNGKWFRYHHLFAEFLQRRLERHRPDTVANLHATASMWFAANGMIAEAVHHSLAAGNSPLATDIVETAAFDLLQRAQFATLLALADMLPPAMASSRPRLQVAVGLASLGTMRTDKTKIAADNVYAVLENFEPGDSEAAALRVEANVLDAAVALYADDTAVIDDLVQIPISAPDRHSAWAFSAASSIATFRDLYTFDFAAARERPARTARHVPPSASIVTTTYMHCFAGLAAREQLDIEAAETHLRAARELGLGAGARSHPAVVAGALLGELLYEKGALEDAEPLLNTAHELAEEGGTIDFLIAIYAIRARLQALRGSTTAALQSLDEGAAVARSNSLLRLAAAVRSERSRLALMHGVSAGPDEPAIDLTDAPRSGTLRVTAEIDEADRIRRLLLAGDAESACSRVEVLVASIDAEARPRAASRSQLLRAACLHAAGRTESAEVVLCECLSTFGRLGVPSPLLDEVHIAAMIDALRTEQRAGRWRAGLPAVPESYFDMIDAQKTFRMTFSAKSE